MAITWNWKDKMGRMTIWQKNKKHTISIYSGNCLAIFLSEWKDNGEWWHSLYSFFADEKHIKNLYKNEGRIFFDKVTDIRLNVAYSNAKQLADILVQHGYSVRIYKKEPKNETKRK